MKLFIQVRDGAPFEHPILESNFRMAFPDIDINNLPDTFAEFIRIKKPDVGVFQVYEGVTYQWVNGKVQDVHAVRDMTPDERQLKIDKTKADWLSFGGYASWIFDEASCSFEPPIPRPQENQLYIWDEPSISWKPLAAQTIEGTE